MPGQESIRPAQKGGDSSLPDAGSRRFSPGRPLPPRLFAERKKEERNRFLPAFFWLRRLFSCPGNKEADLNDPLIFMTRAEPTNHENPPLSSFGKGGNLEFIFYPN